MDVLKTLRLYAPVAGAVVLAGLVAALLAGPLEWGPLAMLAFVLAVLWAAWHSGALAGIIATLLSLGVIAFFFARPIGSIAIATTADRIAIGVFLAVSLLLGMLAGAARSNLRRLDVLTNTLRISQERYRLLFDRSPEPMLVLDEPTRAIVAINLAAEELYGYSRAEFLGMRAEQMYLLEDADRLRAFYEARCKAPVDDVAVASGFRHRRKDGASIDVEIRWTPVRWLGGRVHLVLVRDLTARIRAEAALRESEQKWRSLVESEMALVLLVDRDARITFVNHPPPNVRRDQIVGRRIDEFVPAERREEVEMAIARAWRTGEAQSSESPGLVPFAVDTWYEARWVPIKDNGLVSSLMVLATDCTERRRLNAELQKAKDTAEHASRAKDRFLAVLSHELRAPLSPVLAAVSAFEDDEHTPPQWRATMQMIRRNVQIEARLIDDLLDMTRVTAGKLQLHLELVDARVIVEEAAEICRPDASAKKIALAVHFRARHRFVNADPARLRQAFWNLFNNAIKFTPEGGDIEVVATNDGVGRLRIAVTDTGVGIAPGDLARIFDPFEQVSPFSRRAGGLGLGLAISKMLVDSFEGRLAAESEGPSQGATFVVELPTLPDPEPDKPPLAAGHQTNGRLRILLVEDDDDTRTVMADLLRSRDYDVRETATVAGAILEMQERPFDLIVSDLGLPDGNGNDLIRTLQTIRPVKGIAVSGFGMEEDVRRTREAGFAAHLIKPITLHELCGAIEQVTGRPTT